MVSLSIITSTFNAAATLRHCFLSLVEQAISFEHVIVDGGSTDGTLDVIAGHIKSLKQISGSDPSNCLKLQAEVLVSLLAGRTRLTL